YRDMENNDPSIETPKKKKWYLHWAVIIAGLLLIALIVVYFVKQSQINSLQEEHNATLNELQTEFNTFTTSNSKSNYSLVAQTFSWTIRKEMMNDNLEPINSYFNILVKNNDVQELFLTDASGKIILSTNKKNQDKMFGDLYDPEMIRTDEVKSFQAEDKSLFVASPVFGYDKRLGTLVMKIDPEYFQSEKLEN
ncbi:MAG: hypothetical protein ACOCPM_04605, partial [Bacteroidales bacterium]